LLYNTVSNSPKKNRKGRSSHFQGAEFTFLEDRIRRAATDNWLELCQRPCQLHCAPSSDGQIRGATDERVVGHCVEADVDLAAKDSSLEISVDSYCAQVAETLVGEVDPLGGRVPGAQYARQAWS
jgi:hypothetical protein